MIPHFRKESFSRYFIFRSKLSGFLSRRNTASHRCNHTRHRALPLCPPVCGTLSQPFLSNQIKKEAVQSGQLPLNTNSLWSLRWHYPNQVTGLRSHLTLSLYTSSRLFSSFSAYSREVQFVNDNRCFSAENWAEPDNFSEEVLISLPESGKISKYCEDSKAKERRTSI